MIEPQESLDALILRARSVYAPEPELKVSDFADQHIIVTSGPLAGTKWQTAFAPYQRGILDAFHETGVQTVVVMGSSQWGKTSCAVAVVAYHIAHAPCPILVVEPTVEPMAKDFARNRLEPVIAASPVLRDTVSKKRAKDASNTTLAKTYRGGSIAIGGANSAASLAARSVRLLVLDEIDRYPPELPGEGATISIALKRTQAYGRRKRILILSSPTVAEGPIHTWFKRGDQRRFYVPCPATGMVSRAVSRKSCGHMHAYEWKDIIWEHDDPTTARLTCPSCGYGMSDAERVAVLDDGRWEPEHPKRRDKSIVSFHLWEAYSPLSSLAQIVGSFLFAREQQKTGDHAEMHTWQNTTLGEPVEPDKGVGVESHVLIDRRETIDPAFDLPEGCCCLTAGVDVQDDRLEALVTAWGPGEESWLVDFHHIPGDPQRPEPWAHLDELLNEQYRHPFGVHLLIQAMCIDSAGHRTSMVYDYAHKRQARRVYATIGRDGQRPLVSSPSQRRWGSGEREVPLYTIGVDSAKSIFMSRLRLTEKGAGYVHLLMAEWCDQEFCEQLTSEVLKKTFERGIPKTVWKKIRARNEKLDCALLGFGALRLLNPKLPQMFEQLSAQRPKTPTAGRTSGAPSAGPQAVRAHRRRIIRSSYLG